MTEHEKKILLTKEEYDCLIDKFGKDKPVLKQVNYYYDTEDLSMNRQNITCRIRSKNGKYKATLKRHLPGSDTSTETEVKAINGIYDNDFIDSGMKYQGELVTYRCVILKDSFFEAVLDKNEYLGHTDYELEVEYAEGHENDAQHVMEILLDALIQNNNYTDNRGIHMCYVPSKSERFFERRGENEVCS